MPVSKLILRECNSLRGICWKGGENKTIDYLAEAVEAACQNNGLNVVVEKTYMTSGKVFDRSKVECVVIKNSQHMSDYNYYVITMMRQGIYTFIDFYVGSNHLKLHSGEKSHFAMGSIIRAIKKANVSNGLSNKEEMYYKILENSLSEFLD